MDSVLLEQALKLSPSERLQLIDAIWDTLEPLELGASELADHERAVLDQRIADMEANPDDDSSWSEVKARLEMRRR